MEKFQMFVLAYLFLALVLSCFLSLYKWLLILERDLIGKAVNGENLSGFLLHNTWQLVARPAFRGIFIE
ncbi:hypothetical protein A9239_05270 [Methanosarcina sp. A14]|nr:hypothetical protein A9239_05270 [Methanosarcina sp. A14]